MKILALETSGRGGELALCENGLLIARGLLPRENHTAEMFAPLLAELFRQSRWKPAEIELVAVVQGPGSFTGLRVGVTAAKTFAYAAGAELAALDTLEVIAAEAIPFAEPGKAIHAILNAQRKQFFAASFLRGSAGQFERKAATGIVDSDYLLSRLGPGDALTGPGCSLLSAEVQKRCTPSACWQPRAETVARLGLDHFLAGRRENLWSLAPFYFRPSAAEEKAAKSASPE